jgi:uncharacterized membrane protein YiaA
MVVVYTILAILFLVAGVALYIYGLFSKKEETKE